MGGIDNGGATLDNNDGCDSGGGCVGACPSDCGVVVIVGGVAEFLPLASGVPICASDGSCGLGDAKMGGCIRGD